MKDTTRHGVLTGRFERLKVFLRTETKTFAVQSSGARKDWLNTVNRDRRGEYLARLAAASGVWSISVLGLLFPLPLSWRPARFALVALCGCVLVLLIPWIVIGSATIFGWATHRITRVPSEVLRVIAFVFFAAVWVLALDAIPFHWKRIALVLFLVFYAGVAGGLTLSSGVSTVVPLAYGFFPALFALLLNIRNLEISLILVACFGFLLFVVFIPFSRRAIGSFERAQRLLELQGQSSDEPVSEESAKDPVILGKFEELLQQDSHMTIGIAGRRGIGKSRLLRLFMQRLGSGGNRAPDERALSGGEDIERIRTIRLFVRTPTSFDELSFVTALLEQLAIQTNAAVTRLLPAVKPYSVERELQDKRRLLRWVHLFYVCLIGVCIVATAYQYLRYVPSDPIAFRLRPQRAAEIPVQLVFPDSVAEQLQDLVFNVQAMSDLDRVRLQLGLAELGDLRTEEQWRTLLRESASFRARRDSIRKAQHRLLQLDDSLVNLLQNYPELLPRSGRFSLVASALVYGGIVVGLLLLFFILNVTREGTSRLRQRIYDSVRWEVALFERTNVLLEQIQYQLTAAETSERSAVFAPGGWIKNTLGISINRRNSRQISRQARPFTIFSIVEEFRRYCAEVRFHLNQAIQSDTSGNDEDARPQSQVQIVIAIDELDKISDLTQLRTMLKTMKGVLDLPGVYYLVSVSEDGLEHFRLRQVDQRDELDSTFTHVLKLAPLGAGAVLPFFARCCPAQLLPAAVVLSAGVPRDMHRMRQILGTIPEGTGITLIDFLAATYSEDREALADMIYNDPAIPDEARAVWLDAIPAQFPPATDDGVAFIDYFRKMSFAEFSAASAVEADMAHYSFNRVISLVTAHAAKIRIYEELLKYEFADFSESADTPHADTSTSSNSETWLYEIEFLRDCFYMLEHNPHGVFKRLASE